MKTKQRTFEGISAYSNCESFADSMREIFDVKKIIIENAPIRDKEWMIRWRIIIKYNG